MKVDGLMNIFLVIALTGTFTGVSDFRESVNGKTTFSVLCVSCSLVLLAFAGFFPGHVPEFLRHVPELLLALMAAWRLNDPGDRSRVAVVIFFSLFLMAALLRMALDESLHALLLNGAGLTACAVISRILLRKKAGSVFRMVFILLFILALFRFTEAFSLFRGMDQKPDVEALPDASGQLNGWILAGIACGVFLIGYIIPPKNRS